MLSIQYTSQIILLFPYNVSYLVDFFLAGDAEGAPAVVAE